MTMSAKQQKLVMAGCLCMGLSISMFGLSLSTIQGPLLDRLGGGQYFSLITVLSSIALCVMTPVGGSLAGMMGGSWLIKVFGTASVVCGLLMAFIPNLWSFMIFRVLLAVCQGSFSSLPFIMVRQIYPPEMTPKAVGYLTMSMAVGGLIGSYLAGWLSDIGHNEFAMAFPVVPMILSIVLIAANLKDHPGGKLRLDYLGILLLTVTLSGLLIALNNGPTAGWFSREIVFSFAAGVVGLVGFIAWENRTPNPVIPMKLFMNREYSLLILIAFCMVFYMNSMNVYIPLAVQNILKAGNAVSGMLQIPKTIATIVLPGLAGAWVVRKTSHIWQALAISTVCIIIPFGLLVFLGPKMPVWFIMAVLAFAGASESFRSVALLPAAQSLLSPRDIGVGTSMIGFIITLSGSISGAVFGLAYDSLTKATEGMRGMIDGIDTINLIVALVAFIALMLVVLFFRPMYMKRLEQAKTAKAAK